MCEFSRRLPGPPAEVVARARRPIEASGGFLSGDARRGTIRFSTPVGDVVGEYSISGETIAFRVTEKPFFVPCLTIETYVDRFLFG